MDGDARPPAGPEGVTGYTVRLDARTEPVLRPVPHALYAPMERQADEHQEATEEVAPRAPRWKKALYWFLGLCVLGALIVAGVLYWLQARQFESTDDAFIDGHVSQVSAQIGGRVVKLNVDDNEDVKAGQKLLDLDPRDYQVKLDQARAQQAQAAAQVDQAKATLGTQQAALDQAQANVRVAEADLQTAQTDLARYRAIDPKAITRQLLDTQAMNVKSAQAKLEANRQAVEGARANLTVQKAQIEAAQANLQAASVAVANAELQLSYTHVLAPRDGKVARRTVEVGNYVNPGQALLAVVGADRWVTANFKETQLATMRVGQYVRVGIDACPEGPFDAKVDSFQPGSGMVFSALPAENATGNYVKVVQRVPVKIVFDDADFEGCQLSPGMSVEPKVRVR